VDRSGFLATQEQKGAHRPLPLDLDDAAILELERRGQMHPSALGDVDGAGDPWDSILLAVFTVSPHKS